MFSILSRSLIAGAVAAVGLAVTVQGVAARDTVSFSPNVEPGTIVISASQRKLFYVISPGVAIRYPVAVPKRGKEWSGYAEIEGKYLHPDWTPPDVVRADHPELPNFIPGGSARNPMGFAALTLDRGEVAIHGTSPRMRGSIGTAASYGCIRMLNEDVADLYSRVDIGSPVIMQP